MSSAYHATPGTSESSPNGDQESNVREGRRAPFKQLPDAVMDDDTVSFTGKAVYWYLMRIASFGDHRARVSISTLAAKMGLSAASRRTVRECLDELAQAGWLEVVHRKSPDGKVNLASDYVIHSDLPGVGAAQPLPAPEHGGVGAVQHGGRGCAAPGVGAGEPHSSRSSSSRSSSSRSKSTSPDVADAPPKDDREQPSLPATAPVQAAVQDLGTAPEREADQTVLETPSADDLARPAVRHEAAWLELWDLWPRHVGKAPALKAWGKAVKLADPQEILDGARRYATAMRGTDPRFVKHLGPWLNDQRWTDEPEPASNGRGGGHVPFRCPTDDSAYDEPLRVRA